MGDHVHPYHRNSQLGNMMQPLAPSRVPPLIPGNPAGFMMNGPTVNRNLHSRVNSSSYLNPPSSNNRIPSSDLHTPHASPLSTPFGSPLPTPIKTTNPNEYSPFVHLSGWQNRAKTCNFFVNVNGTSSYPIPHRNIQYYQNAISIEYFWDSPLILPFPCQIDICGEYDTSYQDQSPHAGDKRKNLETQIQPAAKRLKTSDTNDFERPPTPQKTRDVIHLLGTMIGKITNGEWADRSGVIKVLVVRDPNQPKMMRLNGFYFTSHGKVFLKEPCKVMPRQNEISRSDCLHGYAVYVTIRDCATKEILLEHQSMNEKISRIASTVRQNVSLELNVTPKITNKLFLPRNRTKTGSSLLVADLTLFDRNHNVFLCRSAFMWIESHHSGIYYAAMLAHRNSYGYLSVEFRATNTHTTIQRCTLTVPISRISSSFDKQSQSQRMPRLSKVLIEQTEKEDPLDIFAED